MSDDTRQEAADELARAIQVGRTDLTDAVDAITRHVLAALRTPGGDEGDRTEDGATVVVNCVECDGDGYADPHVRCRACKGTGRMRPDSLRGLIADLRDDGSLVGLAGAQVLEEALLPLLRAPSDAAPDVPGEGDGPSNPGPTVADVVEVYTGLAAREADAPEPVAVTDIAESWLLRLGESEPSGEAQDAVDMLPDSHKHLFVVSGDDLREWLRICLSDAAFDGVISLAARPPAVDTAEAEDDEGEWIHGYREWQAKQRATKGDGA